MTRCSITITILLAGALQGLAGDALQVPTHGNWQGQAIGSWTATRITHGSPTKTDQRGVVYKELLLGEDKDANTIVMWGEADENGRYLKDPTTVSGAWFADNPIPSPVETRDEVLKIDGNEYPVIVNVFGPKPDGRSGGVVASTVWELKSRPGFVLMRNESRRDDFKGETFEHLVTEQVIGVGRTNIQGTAVRFFRIRHDETVDGRTMSRMELLKSDELPGQGLIHSRQAEYGEDGQEKSSTQIDLVSCGHAPEEAAWHRAKMQARRLSRECVALDSEAGKVNVAHLMRQGMPEAIAREIVATQLRTADLEYDKTRAEEITTEWNAYQANPSAEKRDRLLSRFQCIGGNNIGCIDPSLEKVLLEISRAKDSRLRIMALSCLTGFVSACYAPVLEDLLIREKQYTNQPALRVLSSTKWGNARRVLSCDGVDLRSLPLQLIPYAPESLAVKELLSRFKAGNKFSRSEILDLLGCYSTPEVRSLFSQLSNDLTADDFAWGKTERSYLVGQVIGAAANLNVENAPALFLKWMAWNGVTAGAGSAPPRDLMKKSVIDMMLMIAGVRLRNPQVNALISKRIRHGEAPLFLLMSDEGLEKLGDIKVDITPKEMESLLSKSVPMMFSDGTLKGEQLYGLLRLFRFSPDDGNVAYIMSKLAPGWTAETDYASMAMARNKYWYVQRKGICPPDPHAMHLEVLADLLPFFGDKGARILIQLCGCPDFCRDLVPALMKISCRRDAAREQLSHVHARSEDDQFLVGLTLWALGDTSRRAKYEQYVRFEPLHASRAHKARRALCYLSFGTVYPLLQDIHNGRPDNEFRLWASTALSCHKNRKSAEFILTLWEEETTSRRNPEYGELFNRMAGRNFGGDRGKIREWVRLLPEE